MSDINGNNSSQTFQKIAYQASNLIEINKQKIIETAIAECQDSGFEEDKLKSFYKELSLILDLILVYICKVTFDINDSNRRKDIQECEEYENQKIEDLLNNLSNDDIRQVLDELKVKTREFIKGNLLKKSSLPKEQIKKLVKRINVCFDVTISDISLNYDRKKEDKFSHQNSKTKVMNLDKEAKQIVDNFCKQRESGKLEKISKFWKLSPLQQAMMGGDELAIYIPSRKDEKDVLRSLKMAKDNAEEYIGSSVEEIKYTFFIEDEGETTSLFDGSKNKEGKVVFTMGYSLCDLT